MEDWGVFDIRGWLSYLGILEGGRGLAPLSQGLHLRCTSVLTTLCWRALGAWGKAVLAIVACRHGHNSTI